jgi:hypothetical protein
MKANIATPNKAHLVEEKYHGCWELEDYFGRLEGKDAYLEVRERDYDVPEYCALVESLMA